MQFILDNIMAVIVTGGIMLMLVAVNHRNKMAATEVTQFYALREQQLNFVEILKRDMQNMVKVESLKEDPTTLTFSFRARTQPGDTTARQVEYKRVLVKNHDGVDLYQVQRYVNGTMEGGSMSTMTVWNILARNAEGGNVTDPADVRQIYVYFEAVNPYSDDRATSTARWESTYRPPMIQEKDII